MERLTQSMLNFSKKSEGERVRYYIFRQDSRYIVMCLDPEYDGPDAQKGEYTGWYFKDEEVSRKVAYLLNELKDPLAGKYLMELVISQLEK